jgi:hypothetical protein
MKTTSKSNRLEYVASFTKATGEVRTMRFTTSQENLRKQGLITVYDVENRGLRKFNLSTLIGRIAVVQSTGALSFLG